MSHPANLRREIEELEEEIEELTRALKILASNFDIDQVRYMIGEDLVKKIIR